MILKLIIYYQIKKRISNTLNYSEKSDIKFISISIYIYIINIKLTWYIYKSTPIVENEDKIF